MPMNSESLASPVGLLAAAKRLDGTDVGLEFFDPSRARANIAQRRVAARDAVTKTAAGKLLQGQTG